METFWYQLTYVVLENGRLTSVVVVVDDCFGSVLVYYGSSRMTVSLCVCVCVCVCVLA